MSDRLRVITAADPRLTRHPRTMARAQDRARWLVMTCGTAEIQQRRGDGWVTVQRFSRPTGTPPPPLGGRGRGR